MTLFMLRLDPDVSRFARWAAAEGLLPAGSDPGYAWHAILRAAFGDLAPRPFRLVERRGKPDYLVGYAAAAKDALLEHANAFADPVVSEALNLSSLAVKPMPASFRSATRLGFEVRVRPVIRQDRDGDRRRSRERDVFLAAIDGLGAESRVEREAVYVAWLRARLAAGGAEATAPRVAGLHRSRVLRRCADRKPILVEGPDVVFEGMLTVRDPAAFARLLARGVGRHRAFGFGMLLLKPSPG